MRTVWWEDGAVRMVDQRKLPSTFEILTLRDYREVAEAIRNMSVRGAPAIGATGALGLALAARQYAGDDAAGLRAFVDEAAAELAGTRPTAVNLFWGLERMRRCLLGAPDADAVMLRAALLEEALAIAEEDVETNRRLGAFGAELISDGDSVLTHCNAGALACVDHGTALGVIRAAWAAGKRIHVFVDETRPLLQGARLTAWELTEAGIPMTLITDNMAGHFMKAGRVNRVVVGADRIAANGDTANKIGTYGVAVLANENNVPFYVAAPLSTVDLALETGDGIPIEERKPEEVTGFGGVRWTPPGVRVANPAFDVTPHRYVRGIITELGVLRPPYTESLRAAVAKGALNAR